MALVQSDTRTISCKEFPLSFGANKLWQNKTRYGDFEASKDRLLPIPIKVTGNLGLGATLIGLTRTNNRHLQRRGIMQSQNRTYENDVQECDTCSLYYRVYDARVGIWCCCNRRNLNDQRQFSRSQLDQCHPRNQGKRGASLWWWEGPKFSNKITRKDGRYPRGPWVRKTEQIDSSKWVICAHGKLRRWRLHHSFLCRPSSQTKRINQLSKEQWFRRK